MVLPEVQSLRARPSPSPHSLNPTNRQQVSFLCSLRCVWTSSGRWPCSRRKPHRVSIEPVRGHQFKCRARLQRRVHDFCRFPQPGQRGAALAQGLAMLAPQPMNQQEVYLPQEQVLANLMAACQGPWRAGPQHSGQTASSPRSTSVSSERG